MDRLDPNTCPTCGTPMEPFPLPQSTVTPQPHPGGVTPAPPVASWLASGEETGAGPGLPSPPVLPGDPWAPSVRPRVSGSIVVPAISASMRGVIFTPAAAVRTVRATRRGVGCYTAGGWVLLWEGDNELERDAALQGVLDDLSAWRR